MAPIFWNKMWLHSWFAHCKSVLQCWGVSCTCSLFPSFLSCPLEQLLEWWDESWGLLLWFKPALNGIGKIQVAQKLLQVVGTGEKGQGWRWGLATASSSSLLFKPLMPLQVLPLQRVGKSLADHLRASLCLSQSSCLLGCLKSQMLCCLNREPRLLPWHRSMLLRTLLLKLRGSNGLKSVVVWSGEGDIPLVLLVLFHRHRLSSKTSIPAFLKFKNSFWNSSCSAPLVWQKVGDFFLHWDTCDVCTSP